jgi:hypothetical protein
MIEKKNISVRLDDQDATLGVLLARGIPGGRNMTDCPSTECLIEFIEGSIAPENREKIVAHLNACAACSDVVLESLAVSEELDRRSRERTKRYVAFSVPAGLAAAALLLLVFKTWQHAPEVSAPSERSVAYRQTLVEVKPQVPMTQKLQKNSAPIPSFANQLSNRLAGNGSLLLDLIDRISPRHKKMFGFSSTVPLEKRIFRIGARLTDVEVARRANDAERTALYARRLIELMKATGASTDGLSAMVERRSTGEKTDLLEGFSRSVEASFAGKKESTYLRFGAWVEAASLAAEEGRDVVLDSDLCADFRKELDKTGMTTVAQQKLVQVESILAAGGLQTEQFKSLSRLFAEIKETF